MLLRYSADVVMEIFMKRQKYVFLFLFLPAFLFALIPDNSSVRRQLLPLLQAPVSQVLTTEDRVIQDPFSQKPVSFNIEQHDDKLYLMFMNEQQGEYPVVGSGNMIIRRSLITGEIEQLKIYLDDIGAVVMRIIPSGGRSLMSLSLFDQLLYDNLTLGVAVEQLIAMNIETIIELSAGRVSWDQLSPPKDTRAYEPLISIVNELRQLLPYLPDTEDGALDAQGHFVRIETQGLHALPGFNCSGFAKFVSDGVYSPLQGSFMKIARLKVKHLDLRGNDISAVYEESRDPYFGLDWTRNIATEIASLQEGRQVHSEFSDLRDSDFYTYQEDMGYAVRDITQLLYLQSIQNPGLFYLGSINGEFGSDPQLWQHYHIVVLYPYFDREGRFHIAVMERNVETSVQALKQRYPQQFIHLVAILPETDYRLPQLFP